MTTSLSDTMTETTMRYCSIAKAVFLPAVLSATACTTAADPEPVAAGNACPAGEYRSLVGVQLTAATIPAGLNTRIIRPGDAVTQDFMRERMNIELDEAGVITRIYCG